jgi:hypothetical protein
MSASTPVSYLPPAILECLESKLLNCTGFYEQQCYIRLDTTEKKCSICSKDFNHPTSQHCQNGAAATTGCDECPIGNTRCSHVFHKRCLVSEVVPYRQYLEKDDHCWEQCCKWFSNDPDEAEEASMLRPIVERLLAGEFDRPIGESQVGRTIRVEGAAIIHNRFGQLPIGDSHRRRSVWTQEASYLFANVGLCLVAYAANKLGFCTASTTYDSKLIEGLGSNFLHTLDLGLSGNDGVTDTALDFWRDTFLQHDADDLTLEERICRNMHNLWLAMDPNQWDVWAEHGYFQSFAEVDMVKMFVKSEWEYSRKKAIPEIDELPDLDADIDNDIDVDIDTMSEHSDYQPERQDQQTFYATSIQGVRIVDFFGKVSVDCLPAAISEFLEGDVSTAKDFLEKQCFIALRPDRETCPLCWEDFNHTSNSSCTNGASAETGCFECPISNSRCSHVFHKQCLLPLLGIPLPPSAPSAADESNDDDSTLTETLAPMDAEDGDIVQEIRCPFRCSRWCVAGEVAEEVGVIRPLLDRLLRGNFDNSEPLHRPWPSWTPEASHLFTRVGLCLVGYAAMKLSIAPRALTLGLLKDIRHTYEGCLDRSEDEGGVWHSLDWWRDEFSNPQYSADKAEDWDRRLHSFLSRNMNNMQMAMDPAEWHQWAEKNRFQGFCPDFPGVEDAFLQEQATHQDHDTPEMDGWIAFDQHDGDQE